MKALVTFDYTKEELDYFRSLGYEVVYKKNKDLEFSEEIADIDMLLCFDSFDKIDISKFENLKWIQLLSAGINQVPLDIVSEKGILLTNNRGCYSMPIAEWSVLKVLEMLKNSKSFYKKQKEKNWEVDKGILDLYKKRIGFVGTGSIASETAKRFSAFGVEIFGLNTDGRDLEYFDRCWPTEDIDDFVSSCDIIIVTTPYTEETHHLLDEDVFKHMRDGVYLVNIARGSIIDEKALIENLKSGKIGKAALDVFEEEPLPEDSPLWDMENVYISPHNSWGSERNHERRFYIAKENMKRYMDGKELLNVIDLNKGY